MAVRFRFAFRSIGPGNSFLNEVEFVKSGKWEARFRGSTIGCERNPYNDQYGSQNGFPATLYYHLDRLKEVAASIQSRKGP